MTDRDLSNVKTGEGSDAKKIYDPLTEKSLNSVSVLGPSLVRRRCGSCGMEWESVHYAEPCPLEELEWTCMSRGRI